LISGCTSSTRSICQQIDKETQGIKNIQKKYHAIFYSCLSLSAKLLIERYGCTGIVQIYNLQCNLIPLDYDLYSRTDSSVIKSLYLKRDISSVKNISESILQLESYLGTPKRTVTLGKNAKSISELTKTLAAILEKNTDYVRQNQYDLRVIIDREIDYLTPLVTADTVESIFHDEFKITYGNCKIPAEFKHDEKRLDCSHKNFVFSNVRDQHIIHAVKELSFVMQRINNKLETVLNLKGGETELTKIYMESTEGKSELKKDLESKKTSAILFKMCEYIQQKRNSPFASHKPRKENFLVKHSPQLIIHPNLQECRDLQNSILLCDSKDERANIIKTIQEFMLRQNSPESNLISICLLCILVGGFKEEEFDKLKTTFVHNYGCRYLSYWHNLEKVNLITKSTNLKKEKKSSIIETFESLLDAGNVHKFLKLFDMLPLDKDYKDKFSRGTAGIFVPIRKTLKMQLLQDLKSNYQFY